jgi:RNA polymerase sigma-32 factor
MARGCRQSLLEPEQEQQLARRWREFGDRKAADELVTSHLRLAAKVARRYKGYGLPLADIVAEANLGLTIAVSRFDPDRGARLSTYALWWIKATILDHILRSWSLVRIGTTRAERKLFFRLRREMNKLAGTRAQLNAQAAEAVALSLGVEPHEAIEMDCRLRGDASLNRPINDDGQTVEWEDLLVDPAPNAEAILVEQEEGVRQRTALDAALKVLTDRERHVFVARLLARKPLTLDQLAQKMSISAERVRQIEAQAFAKVKRAARNRLRTTKMDSRHEASARTPQILFRYSNVISCLAIGDAWVRCRQDLGCQHEVVWTNDRVPRISANTFLAD